ncbi:MAG: hypothetical protein Fur0037_10790 [Planctomycetota bacterium]
MSNANILLLLPAALLALAAPAQDAPAPRAIGPSWIRIDCRGPAAFRQQLLPTNVGTMLSSAAGERIWKATAGAVEAEWAKVYAEPGTFAEARRRILDYAGNIRIQIHVGADGPEGMTALAYPDGHSDLAAIGVDLARMVERVLGQRLEAKPLGDRTLRQAARDQGHVVLDVLGDGRLLFASAPDAARAGEIVADALASAPESGSGPLLRLEVDLGRGVASSREGEDEAWFSATGLDSLRTLEVSLSASGPRIQLDYRLSCEGDRGLFAGLFPAGGDPPDLFEFCPKDAIGAKTSRFDALALWDAVLQTEAARHDRTAEDMEREAREETGLDLRNDVLAKLSGEALAIFSPPADTPAVGFGWPRVALVVGLKDGPAFATAFAKMLEKGDLHPETREGVLRAGRDAHWFFPEIHFGVSKEAAVMAIGAEGEDLVERILARQGEKGSLPGTLARCEHLAPLGFNGAGRLSIESFLRFYAGMIQDALSKMLLAEAPDVVSSEETRANVERFLPLLVEHDLAEVVVLSGTKGGTTVLRILW